MLIGKWKQIQILAFVCIGLLAFGAKAASAVEITVWCWDKNFNGAVMSEAAKRYAALRPDVTIKIVDMAKADLEQKLQTQLLSGSNEGLPDVVLIDDTGAQKYLQSFPGAFVSLNDHIDYEKFAPYKIKLATLDGKTYSLPFDSGVTGLFYRSDLLAAAGFKADDLQNITWDRLIEIGKQVKSQTGKNLLPLIADDAGWLHIMMQSAGSWYFDQDGKVTIAGNPVIRAALDTYQRLIAADISRSVNGWTEYTGSFTSGDTAATFSGVWITGTIKANADQSGLWAVAPIPRLAGLDQSINASNLGGSSWYVLSAGQQKDIAIDFLAQIWGKDVDFYQKILIDQGAVGSLLTAREGSAYQATDKFFGGEPVWQNFSTWLGEIPSVNYGVYSSEADAAVAGQIPALTSGGDIDDILNAIDAQVRLQIQ